MMRDEPLATGPLIAGKYRIDSILGRGAMGMVVAATNIGLRQTVALKFLEHVSRLGKTPPSEAWLASRRGSRRGQLL
jgi:serine/threonine protein kinase